MSWLAIVIYVIALNALAHKQALSVNRFFVYDWPGLVNRYANFTDRDHRGHGVEFPQWKENYGAGRVIDAQNFEYKTSQFALFKLMYERALIDKRRTLDPSDAVSFLIPYDFGSTIHEYVL
jgi:hypothetical protein